MKVKVKVATNTTDASGKSTKQRIVSAKSGSIFPTMPKMNHVEQKRTKSIFGKMAYIIIEDVRSIFHKDRKSKEEKMKYEAFMEMCKK